MFIVQLEFKRIQTFLFSSFRFKDMVGANAMLGNVLRQELPKLHKKYGPKIVIPSAPEITTKPDDPLNLEDIEFQADLPKALWQQGILSRDGGHFYCAHEQQDEAEAFLRDAEMLIQNQLPGVQVSFSLVTSEELNLASENNREPNYIDKGNFGADSFPPLPIFQPCQFGEQGIAESKAFLSEGELRYQSKASQAKISFLKNEQKSAKQKNAEKQSGEEPEAKQTSADVASSMMRQWINDYESRQPQDLDKLVGKDYLAVIVADGNNMGLRFKAYADKHKTQDWLEKQALAEQFFYSARVAMRCAVKGAIENTFKKELKENKGESPLPFQLLMLGGDDLLIACRAKDALPLAKDINEKLLLAENKLADDKPMSLGIGVAIASHNLPFYRLHHVAEELAGSAKVLARSHDGLAQSAIDWQVITQSWVDDPITARKQQNYLNYTFGSEKETLILTGKPYLVSTSNEQQGSQQTLQRLLDASKAIYEAIEKQENLSENESRSTSEVARSQLRYLQGELDKGKRHTEAVWNKLPPSVRRAFCVALPEQPLPWSTPKSAMYQTPIADIVELIEINKLSRADMSEKSTEGHND